MRLVRNTTEDGSCKYALVRLDKLDDKARESFLTCAGCASAGKCQDFPWPVEIGKPHSDEEFFVIKLKDIHAPAALRAYADSAASSDPELSRDVRELADRAASRTDARKPD